MKFSQISPQLKSGQASIPSLIFYFILFFLHLFSITVCCLSWLGALVYKIRRDHREMINFLLAYASILFYFYFYVFVFLYLQLNLV